jgi:hypothetical protein
MSGIIIALLFALAAVHFFLGSFIAIIIAILGWAGLVLGAIYLVILILSFFIKP